MDSIFRTHIGNVRQINQDYGLITSLDDETMLVIVADGMGGHKAGEVASQIATQHIEAIIKESWPSNDWENVLLTAVEKTNEHIFTLSKQNSEYTGMGTTVEVGLLTKSRGLIAHVGDSRVYLFDQKGAKQLTEDHSLVFELYKSGQIPYEELETHPQKNVILRAIGTEPHIKIDLISFAWEDGGRVLFCTDGLFKHVSSEKIIHTFFAEKDISILADNLMNQALDLGGEDNITIAIVAHASVHHGGENT